MSASANAANRLAGETSPYLLQHAGNPVDWYPWGPEALERAAREQRPILLSIGYSACHWCHVMAHESFEDPETAALMNRLFVNIKVDREERPDLDRIYQNAHQLLTQRPGGWPLTVFLTHDDHTPFFAGTYFPPAPRHGLPAFRDLLQRVAAFYPEHRAEIRRQGAAVVEALEALAGAGAGEGAIPGPEVLDEARAQLLRSYDRRHGGFGGAPKFPHPTSIDFLLRRAAAGDDEARGAALHTLLAMAAGGLYDQLGGGFCRYSVDERWEIPHFEKMLYDNGPLLALYAEAWAATGEARLREVAVQTAEWVMREMQSPAGGYYSTLDADSEGEEGRFYVWARDEVRACLDAGEYAAAELHYGLDGAPNFEGRWHLRVAREPDAVAAALGISADEVRTRLTAARGRLFAAREGRVRPGRDEKILTSWNALMIRGLCIAARHLDAPELLASAERALAFVRTVLWRDGRLLATCRDGRAHLDAYLDDYAFLLDALLELLQLRWRAEDLDFARALADALLEHFEDRGRGGFYFTADDHERLIQRPKPWSDDSTPAGNGVAARALARLGHLIGEPRYLDAAARTLQAAGPVVRQAPYAYLSLLGALEESLSPPETVVLRGRGRELEAWWARCARPYAPGRMSVAIPDDAADLPPALAARRAGPGVTAYLCRGTSCSAPITAAAELEGALAAAG